MKRYLKTQLLQTRVASPDQLEHSIPALILLLLSIANFFRYKNVNDDKTFDGNVDTALFLFTFFSDA